MNERTPVHTKEWRLFKRAICEEGINAPNLGLRAISAAVILLDSRDSRLIAHGLRKLHLLHAAHGPEVLQEAKAAVHLVQQDPPHLSLAFRLLSAAADRKLWEDVVFRVLWVKPVSVSGPLTQTDAHSRLVAWLLVSAPRQTLDLN